MGEARTHAQAVSTLVGMTLMLIPGGDFDDSSALNGLCYVSHTRKRKSDPGIFRGENIEYEGFLDISCMAIEHAAQQIGWVPPEKVEALKQETTDVVDMLEAAHIVNANLRSEIEGLSAALKSALGFSVEDSPPGDKTPDPVPLVEVLTEEAPKKPRRRAKASG